MSRVFDAQREAARRRGENSAPIEAVWKALGIISAGVPGIEKESTPAISGSEASELGTGENLEVPAETSNVDGPGAAQVSFAGISAKIALDKKARLIPHTADVRVVERYRMLRTKILQEREKKFFRSLVIASASPQEGKTVTVLNLALSFAALPSFRVLVIDGDMRKGTLGDWLGIDSEHPGLSNLIEGSAQLEQVLLNSEELAIHIIPRGNAHICDLQPSQFNLYFRQLAEQFDLVLVDTPPVNLITDAQIMAASCDAVLLVARAFSTTNKALEEAVDKLQPFRVIGSVLNAGTPRSSHKYHGYY